MVCYPRRVNPEFEETAVCGCLRCGNLSAADKNRRRPDPAGNPVLPSAMLVTTPAKKSVQSRLQEKGKYRKKGGASGILGMYPAGTGELGVIKSRDEFLEGREGDELWYKHVEENRIPNCRNGNMND